MHLATLASAGRLSTSLGAGDDGRLLRAHAEGGKLVLSRLFVDIQQRIGDVVAIEELGEAHGFVGTGGAHHAHAQKAAGFQQLAAGLKRLQQHFAELGDFIQQPSQFFSRNAVGLAAAGTSHGSKQGRAAGEHVDVAGKFAFSVRSDQAGLAGRALQDAHAAGLDDVHREFALFDLNEVFCLGKGLQFGTFRHAGHLFVAHSRKSNVDSLPGGGGGKGRHDFTGEFGKLNGAAGRDPQCIIFRRELAALKRGNASMPSLLRFGNVMIGRSTDFRGKTAWHATCLCGRQRLWQITYTP